MESAVQMTSEELCDERFLTFQVIPRAWGSVEYDLMGRFTRVINDTVTKNCSSFP